MNLTGVLGLLFILIFIVAWIVFVLLNIGRKFQLRELSAYSRFSKAIGITVEAGKRLHVSLGRGSVIGPQVVGALVGVGILERIARLASVGDRPPVATSGEGMLAILSQDALRSTYAGIDAAGQYHPSFGQVTGLTALSYTAGVMPIVADEHVSTTIFTGHAGSEVGLILEASDRQGGLVMAGSDNLAGQAVMLAAAQEPLIGEDLYAAGAYFRKNSVHIASLYAQDLIRWLLITIMIIGALLAFFGFFK